MKPLQEEPSAAPPIHPLSASRLRYIAPMLLTPGSTLGPYVIASLLGEGWLDRAKPLTETKP